VLVPTAMLALGWSLMTLNAARSEALLAQRDLQDVRRLGRRIESLHRRSSVAGSATVAATELARRSEEAARSAGMADSSLSETTPQTSQRVGESAYKEVPTNVVLTGVTLRQVVRFILTMTAQDSGLQARSLILSAPDDSFDDSWRAELSLAYLIYEPSTGQLQPGQSPQE